MPDEQSNVTPPANTSPIASDWAIWEELLSMGSDSSVGSREVVIEQSIESFVDRMQEDPAYQQDATINGSETPTPIIAIRRTGIECDIKAIPETNIHVGDIVDCLNEKWLVVELYSDKIGIICGKMWICNDILHFQNHSSDIISRYCVIDDGSYPRIFTDPIAYIPTNTYKLYLSLDDLTSRLYIDKRISCGTAYDSRGDLILEVYKIVGIDLKSKNFGAGSHLMVISLQRDVYDAQRDDLESLVCDYYISPEDLSEPSQSGSCAISGKESIRIGTTKKYIASFRGENNIIVNGVIPSWSVDAPEGISYSVLQDGELSINVPMIEDAIGSEITITLSDSLNEYGSFTKKVQVIAVG